MSAAKPPQRGGHEDEEQYAGDDPGIESPSSRRPGDGTRTTEPAPRTGRKPAGYETWVTWLPLTKRTPVQLGGFFIQLLPPMPSMPVYGLSPWTRTPCRHLIERPRVGAVVLADVGWRCPGARGWRPATRPAPTAGSSGDRGVRTSQVAARPTMAMRHDQREQGTHPDGHEDHEPQKARPADHGTEPDQGPAAALQGGRPDRPGGPAAEEEAGPASSASGRDIRLRRLRPCPVLVRWSSPSGRRRWRHADRAARRPTGRRGIHPWPTAPPMVGGGARGGGLGGPIPDTAGPTVAQGKMRHEATSKAVAKRQEGDRHHQDGDVALSPQPGSHGDDQREGQEDEAGPQADRRRDQPEGAAESP